MARFRGSIGFSETRETAPGVHTEEITERTYSGDVLQDSRSWEKAETLNDNLVLRNRFSIVADAFAYQNFQAMRYVKYFGALWKITNAEIQRPRIILTVGGVYNASES